MGDDQRHLGYTKGFLQCRSKSPRLASGAAGSRGVIGSALAFPSVSDAIRASNPDYGEKLPLGPMRARSAYSRCGQHPHHNGATMAVILPEPDSAVVNSKRA